MDDSQATSLEQIRALVAANSVVRFAGQRREEVYQWVERALVRHEYAGLRKPDKGVLRPYIAQMTGVEPSAGDALELAGTSGRAGSWPALYERTALPNSTAPRTWICWPTSIGRTAI